MLTKIMRREEEPSHDSYNDYVHNRLGRPRIKARKVEALVEAVSVRFVAHLPLDYNDIREEHFLAEDSRYFFRLLTTTIMQNSDWLANTDSV